MDSVRHIVAAERAPRVALGQFERTVEVWDLRPVRRVAKFETVLDFGGRRLVLSDGGDVLVAAAYHRFGVAAYAADTGMLLWQRRDIKRPQCLSVSHSSRIVYVGVEGGPCLALSLDDGTQVRQLRGVRDIVESPYDSLALLDQARPIVAAGSGLERLLFAVERTTFAFLATAFSRTHIAISEAGGSVRGIALNSGQVAWTFTPPDGVHCLQLAYCKGVAAFVGVLWPFANGGEKELVVFDGAGGLHEIRRIKGSAEECFCNGNSGLLTSNRMLINLASNDESALVDNSLDEPS